MRSLTLTLASECGCLVRCTFIKDLLPSVPFVAGMDAAPGCFMRLEHWERLMMAAWYMMVNFGQTRSGSPSNIQNGDDQQHSPVLTQSPHPQLSFPRPPQLRSPQEPRADPLFCLLSSARCEKHHIVFRPTHPWYLFGT